MNNTTPRISVVIPLYNKEKTIKKTIQSVLDQQFTDFELVIVNDGSKDNSVDVVKAIDDPRIRIIDKPNGGVSSARNEGIRQSKYEYIAFLDADDEWRPNHLFCLVELINQFGNEASIFTTNFYRCFSKRKLHINRNDLNSGIVKNYFKEVRKGVLINSSTACISRDLLKEVGGFKEKYTIGEDIDLWNRLARKGVVAYSSLATSIYHIDAPNNSRTNQIDYRKDAANDAFKDVSCNIYDLISSVERYIKLQIKRLVRYQPRIKEPK